jgi:tetratricopeptide (TPR) repeat protein
MDAYRFSIMKSKFSDTLAFIELAKSILGSIMQDAEGLAHLSQEARNDLKEQMSLTYLHSGVLGRHTNDHDMSLKNHRVSVQILRDANVNEPETHRMGVALNELGNACLQNGDTIESERCFRKSLSILQAVPNTSAGEKLIPLISLGFALWMQGRHEDAATAFQEALDARESEYGVDDTRSLTFVYLRFTSADG